MARNNKRMTFFTGQKRIAILWFTLSAILFTIVFAMSMMAYENFSEQLWGWLLPNTIPTLSIIIGVFVAEFDGNQKQSKDVNKFYFRLTFFMSLFYLVILISILLIGPIINKNAIESIENTDTFLIPLQGLVAATIGVFFVKNN